MRRQRRLGSDGDDLPVFLPNLLEQLGEEFATLGSLGLGGPEAAEIIENLPSAVQMRIGRRVDSLHLFLKSLAPHDVLGLGQVAHLVEVAQPLKLPEKLTSLGAPVAAAGLSGLRADRVDDPPL